uniref:ComEA family DNA-binding protein n=1 Tax=Vibrio sp. S9_S30 TaxID=2720226 RepID=UPI001EED527F|nr:ComEA family DNA-binding protein [Vibrio sp. S9_S30]
MSLPVLSEGTTTPPTSSKKADKHDGIEITVNINTATAEELETLLIGIGEKKAKDIIQFRQENGLFEKAEDLMKIKGIGKSTIEKNKDRILL